MSLLHKFTTAILTLGAIGVLFSCGSRYTYQTVEGDPLNARKIGRASCRERVYSNV